MLVWVVVDLCVVFDVLGWSRMIGLFVVCVCLVSVRNCVGLWNCLMIMLIVGVVGLVIRCVI